MKLFAITDTHGRTDFSVYHEQARQADLIVHCGDFTMFGRESARDIFAQLQELAEQAGADVVIVHGNHDWNVDPVEAKPFDRVHFLHGEVREFERVVVLGFGGGGFATQDPEFEQFIDSTYKNGLPDKPVVWVMHGPPHGMGVDEVPGWGPVGCRSRRAMIEKFGPHLVLSGHIHECAGKQAMHDESVLMNPGSEGALIEISYSMTNWKSNSESS